jgi:hypothetical protein
MKIARCILIALMFASSSTCVSASTDLANPSSYSLINSKQTWTLVPGSPVYKQWEAWIRQKNALRPFLGRSNSASIEVGQITIIKKFDATVVSGNGKVQLANSAPPDNGPPGGLPAQGTPGQQLQFINQTPSIYQAWTYEWVGGLESGGGGWSETSYVSHACVDSP